MDFNEKVTGLHRLALLGVGHRDFVNANMTLLRKKKKCMQAKMYEALFISVCTLTTFLRATKRRCMLTLYVARWRIRRLRHDTFFSIVVVKSLTRMQCRSVFK